MNASGRVDSRMAAVGFANVRDVVVGDYSADDMHGAGPDSDAWHTGSGDAHAARDA